MTDKSISRLTSGSLLARNTILNLLGRGAPLLVAIICVPMLIRGLGIERFGIMTLAWAVVGYFSLFDLGLGRALTKVVAEKLGAGEEETIPALIWTCLLMMIILGVIGAIVIGLASPWLVYNLLKISKALQSEALSTFYLLALSVPIVISTAGLKGVLEAQQRFGVINAIDTIMGIFSFLGPLLVLIFSQSLVFIVAVIIAGRFISGLVYLLFSLKITPALRQGIVIKRSVVASLLRFGSWITVSAVLSQLMVYLDRFLIGSLLSVTIVTYYVTPYELVSKLWIIPEAMMKVLFPAFSYSFVRDPVRTLLLFSRGVKYIFIILFPLGLLILALAYEGLDLWLGREFAENSTVVLQWLTIGVFVNSLAFVPYALIQAMGKPDLTAKLHLVELPFYLLGAWWMIGYYGIKGAAIAWVARVTVDAFILFGMLWRLVPEIAPVIRRLILGFGMILIMIVCAIWPMGIVMHGAFLLVMLPTFGFIAWFLILTTEERVLLRSGLKSKYFFNEIFHLK